MWFLKLIRSFFFALDSNIFNFISNVYDLLITISRTTILSQSDINEFYQKIYALLGIFMLFKVGFSLITYVVNPDDFSDKSKGIGKIGQNVIISLCMLVLVPYAFNMAYDLQKILLEDNILVNIIFGDPDNDKGTTDYLNTAGDKMAFTILNAFVTPNTSLEYNQNCTNVYSGGNDSNGEPNLNRSCLGMGLIDGSIQKTDNPKNTMYAYTTNYIGSNSSTIDSELTETDLTNYVAGLKKENLGLMFRVNLLKTTIKGDKNVEDETFLMNYRYPFSTVVGVVTLLLLIGFCLDVALRSVKLAFLQLIAPIPIISFIDPKSGKDGIFKKWYKMCFSTFLSLFVRLLALYFGIYIISKVSTMTDIVTGGTVTNGFVQIFIIIGVLMFAKQLPKILEGLGIKIDGDGKFNLNPLKKIEDGMIGGKTVSKLGKGLAIGAGGAALVGGASLLTGKGLHGTGTAMKNAITGGFKGNKFGKNFSTSYGAGAARKRQIAQMKNDGVSPAAVGFENFKNKFVGMTAKDKYDDFTSSVKSIQDGYKNYYNGVVGGDKVAKALDQRRIAAENRGDFDASKRLQDAIDARVKEVRTQGGKIQMGSNADIDKYAEDIEKSGSSSIDVSKIYDQTDQGLVNISGNIDKTIDHINNNYSNSFDYDKTSGFSKTDDLKTTNGKSKSIMRAAETSDEARKISDKYKYVKNDSKK